MKLICLNTWGGKAGAAELLAFLDSHRDADFFCLQEIWSAPYENFEGARAGAEDIAHAEIMVYGRQRIKALLQGHRAFFHPHHLNDYGLMMLVSKRLPVVRAGDVYTSSAVSCRRATSACTPATFSTSRSNAPAARSAW